MDKIYRPEEIGNSVLKSIAEGPVVVKKSKGGELKIHAIPAAFDIETTNLPENEQSIMYIWQMRLDGYTIVGRYWYELEIMMNRIRQAFGETRLICYIHNASFEFQFLCGVHEFEAKDVFCIEANKVLYFRWFNVEFRCSYLLSNMSLHLFTKSFNVEHQKLDGDDFDYTAKRYPWTPLTEQEMQYCINDVIGLQEAVIALMARDGDTLATIPYTSTGYVRRDVKERMDSSGEIKFLKAKFDGSSRFPSYDVYAMARAAFRGGNTHANRDITTTNDEQIDCYDVHSYDRSSSYPDVMVNQQFPMGKWFEPEEQNETELLYLLHRKTYALLVDIELTDVHIKDELTPIPYLPADKCGVHGSDIKGASRDNGRVLHASWLRTTVTDIDLRIIAQQYKWKNLKVHKIMACRYGYLPEPIREAVREYYRNKTTLKGNQEQLNLYSKSKALLNAIYGMMVQDPAKTTYEYDWRPDAYDEVGKDPEKAYNKVSRTAFLSYCWGVWVSAWGRALLQEAIDAAAAQGCRVVYVDTDSVKIEGTCDYSEYNKQRIADSTKNGAYAVDSKGRTHYMGVMEEEEDNYGARFRTMGAKKYAYEGLPLKECMSPDDWDQLKKYCDKRGLKCEGCNLHITIAGVAKYVGAIELWNMGGLDKFAPGTTFRLAGGTRSVYNNRKSSREAGYLSNGGMKYYYTSNIYITDSEYTLGLTDDYAVAVWNIREAIKAMKEGK